MYWKRRRRTKSVVLVVIIFVLASTYGQSRLIPHASAATPGIGISLNSTIVDEGGSPVKGTVTLAGNVFDDPATTINLAVTAGGDPRLSVFPDSIAINQSNENTPIEITFSAAHDFKHNTTNAASIKVVATSTDPVYSGLSSSVTVSINDVDPAPTPTPSPATPTPGQTPAVTTPKPTDDKKPAATNADQPTTDPNLSANLTGLNTSADNTRVLGSSTSTSSAASILTKQSAPNDWLVLGGISLIPLTAFGGYYLYQRRHIYTPAKRATRLGLLRRR